jgi:hypothetical protein
MIITLFVINYLVALYMLWCITNDDIWSMIVRDMKFGQDLVEQQKITQSQDLMRKIFCWLLIIPGVGIIMLFIMLKQFFGS